MDANIYWGNKDKFIVNETVIVMNNASRSTIAIEIHKFLGQWIHFQNQFKKHFETYKSASASKLLAEQHKVLNKFLHLRLCNSKLELDHYCSLLNFIVKERVFELRGHSFSNGASKYWWFCPSGAQISTLYTFHIPILFAFMNKIKEFYILFFSFCG